MEGFDRMVMVVIVALVATVVFLARVKRQKLKLPPSPKGRMPVIGHLHMMNDNKAAHQTFAQISTQNCPLTMIYMDKPTTWRPWRSRCSSTTTRRSRRAPSSPPARPWASTARASCSRPSATTTSTCAASTPSSSSPPSASPSPKC